MPNSVTPSMPLNTAVPSERRISAPPRGDHQRNNAEDEGEGGHQDRPQPQAGGLLRGLEPRLGPVRAAAWRIRRSKSRSCTPDRPARPGRSARKCSRSCPWRSNTALPAPNTAGTAAPRELRPAAATSFRTARPAPGIRRRSPAQRRIIAVFPSRICMNISSVHSLLMESGSVSSASLSTVAIASPGTDSRLEVAADRGGRVEVVAIDENRAVDFAHSWPRAPSWTICPWLFRTCKRLMSSTGDCENRPRPARSPASGGRRR